MKSKIKNRSHEPVKKMTEHKKSIPKDNNEKSNVKVEEKSAMGKRVGDWVHKKFSKESYL
jgi:hypothetical protein